MALDFTNETTKEYRERLRKMETEKLVSVYKVITDFGYNCEGLVTADGVIVPRWEYVEKELHARGVEVTPFDSLEGT